MTDINTSNFKTSTEQLQIATSGDSATKKIQVLHGQKLVELDANNQYGQVNNQNLILLANQTAMLAWGALLVNSGDSIKNSELAIPGVTTFRIGDGSQSDPYKKYRIKNGTEAENAAAKAADYNNISYFEEVALDTDEDLVHKTIPVTTATHVLQPSQSDIVIDYTGAFVGTMRLSSDLTEGTTFEIDAKKASSAKFELDASEQAGVKFEVFNIETGNWIDVTDFTVGNRVFVKIIKQGTKFATNVSVESGEYTL